MEARRQLKPGRFATACPDKREEAVMNASGSRVASVLWDFSNDGGAISTFSFKRLLPLGAIITRVFTDETTNITAGAGATIALSAGSTTLVAAQLFSAFSGIQLQTLNGSAAGIKLTADSTLTMAVAVAALTAGRLRWYVEYLISNDGQA